MKKTLISAALFAASSAQAAEPIEPVIVTATRTAQTADQSLSSVTVITRDEIEQSNAPTVVDLLQNRVVGVDVARNGGPGTTTSVFLRGTESDHVLVLVDGVPASSATTGSFDWNSLPPEQIDHIEIVRGPQSTLYGSEAIGGVIQIFTRKNKATSLRIGGGSYDTLETTAGTGHQTDRGGYHINANYFTTRGFSATDKQPDDDGFRNASVTGGFTLPMGDNADLALNLFHSQSHREYDSNPAYPIPADTNIYADHKNSIADLRLNWTTSDIWSQTFSGGYATDYEKTHDSFPAKITTRRSTFSWQNDIQTGPSGLLTIGADYRQVRGEIENSYDQTIYTRAGFVQYQWTGKVLDILAGGRVDHHSEFGDHSTGRLNIGTTMGGVRLVAAYGTAFKAPTFNELFYPGYGNPDLEPEESSTAEISARYAGVKASLFDTRVKNLITSDPITWRAVNTDKARIRGLELSYALTLEQLSARLGATLQNPKDEQTGEQLLRRPKQKYIAVLESNIGQKTHLGLEGRYVGERDDFGDTTLGAYTVMNLTGRYELSDTVTVSGRVENALNRNYETAAGYNTAGRSAYINLRYHM